MTPTDPLQKMKRAVEQLEAFHEIGRALTSTLEEREVLRMVMQKLSELMRPANWSLLLADAQGELRFQIVVGEAAEKLKGMKVEPGEGIAGQVFATGVGRCVSEAALDPAFSPRFDQATSFQTRSVLAVPLRSKGRVLGVIELISAPGEPDWSDDDLGIVKGLADYAAIGIENARNFKRVQELTLTDEHTGLFNTRHLHELLDQEVARAARFKHPVSLVFFDLDGFKNVNDTHGHQVGSAVLREVGGVLRESIRQVDFPFRYGGDEFAALLPETDAGAAQHVGHRLHERLKAHTFTGGQGLALTLTASVGVATYPDDARDALTLLEMADRRMYVVKSSGKDGVRGGGEPG